MDRMSGLPLWVLPEQISIDKVGVSIVSMLNGVSWHVVRNWFRSRFLMLHSPISVTLGANNLAM